MLEREFAGQFDGLSLNRAEHLLVWALRRLAVRAELCRAVERTFIDACRDDAGEVLATFRLFAAALSYAARRRVVVGHPGSPRLTADEVALLRLLGAAQTGDDDHFEALLCWLACRGMRPHLALAARALATAFAANGLWISNEHPPPALTGRPPLRVVR